MKKLLAMVLVLSAGLPLWAAEAAKPPVIILKLDDVRQVKNGIVHPSWLRALAYVETNTLKASFGIICSSLEQDNPAYFDWIKAQQKKGVIEFWLHGYRERKIEDKTGEYEQGSFEEQRAALEKCERLAKEKLGFPLTAFGPHWSGTTDATDRALDAVPEIKIWLYGPKPPKHFSRLSLERVMALENPTFVPDFAKFKATYEHSGAQQPFLVLQGHPPNWTEQRWQGFYQIVEFLRAQHCVFMTPTEYMNSLKK